jgi:hypothetical protein
MVTRRISASESSAPNEATSRGSLGRLWAEFNDPGPAGDALVFAKKYADGIFPGCMGLFFRLATNSDKRTWLPILFGAVFALAGYGVLRLGIRNILRKA